jgi:hypothetical protein
MRHAKRFRTLLGQLSDQIGGSISFACQDWASMKAAKRFLSNERVSEEKILAGHFFCTRERFAAIRDAPVLVLHDTTEFSYHREDPDVYPGQRTKCLRPDSRGRNAARRTLAAGARLTFQEMDGRGLPRISPKIAQSRHALFAQRRSE